MCHFLGSTAVPLLLPLLLLLLLALPSAVTETRLATGPITTSSSATIKSTVFTHGEDGWPCFRIPGTLALPSGVMLSFAAARSYTGDVSRPVQSHVSLPTLLRSLLATLTLLHSICSTVTRSTPATRSVTLHAW
jgi:hypothetical protein